MARPLPNAEKLGANKLGPAKCQEHHLPFWRPFGYMFFSGLGDFSHPERSLEPWGLPGFRHSDGQIRAQKVTASPQIRREPYDRFKKKKTDGCFMGGTKNGRLFYLWEVRE